MTARRPSSWPSAFRPEVILLDIGLPGMDGYAVARQLRQEDCCRDTLIIGISGYGDQKAREQARQAGFDHLLVKPVDIAVVTELIASGKPRGDVGLTAYHRD